MNPQALVPSLETDSGVLSQSLAIIEWLDETCPVTPLLPGNATERARIRSFAQIIACDIHPLQNLRVLDYLRDTFDADQPALDTWCQRWIGDGLTACEALVSGQHEYCFGDTPGLADICLVPQIFSAKRFGLDLSAFPKLVAIFDRCMTLPAFADAAPMHQPDAE
jgi:maleylacetoacetate isomerase